MKRNGTRTVRAALLLSSLALAATVAPAGDSAEPETGEYHVKAAFLLNFARLVQWPGHAFSDARSPLTVGLLSSTSSSEQLRTFLEGKAVGSRKLQARRVESAREAGGFHIVFVGASSGAKAGEVAGAIAGGPVLLVGESEGFARNGGAINFFSDGDKIRFEVNPRAAAAAGLRVSSRLLRVAKIVSDG